MLATVASEMPRGDGWVFEPKYDGIRILAVVRDGEVRLLSRNAIDRTGGFPEVAEAVRALAKRARLGALVLDGELVARTADGIGRFSDLQQRGKAITEMRRETRARDTAHMLRPRRGRLVPRSAGAMSVSARRCGRGDGCHPDGVRPARCREGRAIADAVARAGTMRSGDSGAGRDSGACISSAL